MDGKKKNVQESPNSLPRKEYFWEYETFGGFTKRGNLNPKRFILLVTQNLSI